MYIHTKDLFNPYLFGHFIFLGPKLVGISNQPTNQPAVVIHVTDVAQEWRSGFRRVCEFPLRHKWQSSVHQQGAPEGDGFRGVHYYKQQRKSGGQNQIKAGWGKFTEICLLQNSNRCLSCSIFDGVWWWGWGSLIILVVDIGILQQWSGWLTRWRD